MSNGASLIINGLIASDDERSRRGHFTDAVVASLGREGWEMVSNHGGSFWFKRPLADDAG